MRALQLVALAALALVLSGCARLHARAEPISPPLEIPSPPPRVITSTLPATVTAAATTDAIPPDPPPAVPEPPAEVDARRPPRPTPSAPAARQEKPETPLPAPPRPPQSAPSQTLQTTTNVGQVEQRVRTTIVQASRDLGRINPRALNAEAKAQYDIARRFAEQAGDALTAKNFVFAEQLADKAAALAALLLSQ